MNQSRSLLARPSIARACGISDDDWFDDGERGRVPTVPQTPDSPASAPHSKCRVALSFAGHYNTLFTDATTGKSTAYRVYNMLDAIPNAWASLSTIATYYQPAPLCPEYIKEIIAEAEKDVGSD